VSAQLDAFPDSTAVRYLSSLGVRYAVVHLDELEATRRQRFTDSDLTSLGVSVAASFGSDIVYELSPLTDPAPWQDHAHLQVPRLVARGLPVTVTLSIDNDASQPMVLPRPGAIGAQVQWNGGAVSALTFQDDPLLLGPGDAAVMRLSADVPATLATANSATISARLTGPLQTEVVQAVEFADLPSSTQATGLSGVLERVLVPPVVHASAWVPIQAIARNTGQAVWLPERPSGPAAPGRVGVGMRNWISPNGTSLQPLNYSTVHLDWAVSPGQQAAVLIMTQAPERPGRYQLVLDLVSESVTWFSDLDGGTKTSVPIDVQP
jgi:hypothetical protein